MGSGRRVAASIPFLFWTTTGLIALMRPPSAWGAVLGPALIALNLAALLSTPFLAVFLVRAFFHDAPQSEKVWLGAGRCGNLAHRRMVDHTSQALVTGGLSSE
jgi:hypothetical protein